MEKKHVVMKWQAATDESGASYLPVRDDKEEVVYYDTVHEARTRADELNSAALPGVTYEPAEADELKERVAAGVLEVTRVSDLYADVALDTLALPSSVPNAAVKFPGGNGPGLRRLREHPSAEATRAAVVADQERAKIVAVNVRTHFENSARAHEVAMEEVVKNDQKGKSVKKSKKKTAPLKKAAAAKKVTTDARAPADMKLTDRVKWLADENPCRPGSARHERYETLKAYSGRTVEECLTVLPAATLRNASALGVIKMTSR